MLVFIHSFLWDKEMWRPQIDFFKENIDTIVATGFGIFGRGDTLNRLEEINIPTLYLAGEADIPRPMKESEEIKLKL